MNKSSSNVTISPPFRGRRPLILALILASGLQLYPHQLSAQSPYVMPANARPYWDLLAEVALTLGLGFEGQIELAQPMTEIRALIGHGNPRPGFPDWLFFEDGPFGLTLIGERLVRATEEGSQLSEEWLLSAIQVTRLATEPQVEVNTDRALGLGTHWSQVVLSLGQPTYGIRRSTAAYPELGVTFGLNGDLEVDWILVHQLTTPRRPTGHVYHYQSIFLAQPFTPPHGGVTLSLPADWSTTTASDITTFFRSPEGTWNVQITICNDCSEPLHVWAAQQEALLFGASLLEEEERFLHPSVLRASGAEESYYGEYQPSSGGHAFSLYLRGLERMININIMVDETTFEHDPEAVRQLASAIFAGTNLLH